MRRLILLLVLLVGCTDVAHQVQVQTANAIAVGANAALPVLIDKYRAEGSAAIEASTSREQAEARLVAIKAAWRPVWDAWSVLRAAHTTWSLAAEDGALAALAGLKDAYCTLQNVWPDTIPVLPLVPVSCPPPEATAGGDP